MISPVPGSALLLMDLQQVIVGNFGVGEEFFGALETAATAARGAGVPVIHVVVRFRSGYPEISDRNRQFSTIRAGGMPLLEGEQAAEIHPSVPREPDDLVVTKKRVSAFAGSDLEVVLRGFDVDSLVLAGIATSGVVLSTLRAASDRDYGLTVLSDCCADGDAEVNRVLLEKVFPAQAEVTTAAAWAESVRRS
jgi:nicotinamidase-related amidase